MAEKGKNVREDRGRNFYETSSPFETFTGPSREGKPRTFGGQTDRLKMPESDTTISDRARAPFGPMDPQQYDNPRGYPGMAMVTQGAEKGKWPSHGKAEHSLINQMGGEASLARTGKRT